MKRSSPRCATSWRSSSRPRRATSSHLEGATEPAAQVEAEIAAAWREVVVNIRRRRPRRARRAYDRQAEVIFAPGFREKLDSETVLGVFGDRGPAPLDPAPFGV